MEIPSSDRAATCKSIPSNEKKMSFLLSSLNACRVPMEEMCFEVEKLMSTGVRFYLSMAQQMEHVTTPGDFLACPSLRDIVERNIDIP